MRSSRAKVRAGKLWAQCHQIPQGMCNVTAHSSHTFTLWKEGKVTQEKGEKFILMKVK